MKEARKKEKKEKKEEEMRRLLERKCRAQPCKFAYDEYLVRASDWASCPCKRFYICPSHIDQEQGSQMMSIHHVECMKSMRNE